MVWETWCPVPNISNKLGMLSFRGIIKWNEKIRNILRELNQVRNHCCGKASATGMSLPNVRFWAGAVGDPEKHISYCLQGAPAHFPVQEFLQHHCGFLLRGIQSNNQTRVPQFPNSAHDLCEGLDPCSWAVPAQSRQLSFHWWICCIISLPGPISYAMSVWEDTISLECAMAVNLVLGSPGHSSSHLMVVFLLDDFMDDFITDEGESCLLFEHKGMIQTFCEGWSTTVNKVAACGSNN